jgi:uncharacterized RDD family membrane protein YckC
MTRVDHDAIVSVGHHARMSDVPESALASIGRRFVARVLDLVIVGVPVSVVTWLVSDVNLDQRDFNSPGWTFWLGFLASLAYEIGFIAKTGQTPGKAVMRIRVVSADPSQPLTGERAAVRAVPLIAGALPVIGAFSFVLYLPALWTPRRQGLHDRLAGTIVVPAHPS